MVTQKIGTVAARSTRISQDLVILYYQYLALLPPRLCPVALTLLISSLNLFLFTHTR